MIKNKKLRHDMEYIAGHFEKPGIFEDNTVLITGCAGFLGFYFSNFFAHLIEVGINIKSLVLLDNFFLGMPAWIKDFENTNDKISIHAFDISKDDISRIKLAKEADFIIHMASIASPTYYRKYPIETLDANVWGLRNLLDYYKTFSIKGLLFFSSSEIYGDPLAEFIPTPEDYKGRVSSLGPRACYDEAKRFGETLCYVYANTHNVQIRIVRPFNNYGPGMSLSDRRVPADFANAVINRKDIVIHSDGTPTRTFCYVADAIVGYLKALTYSNFDYFNIGIDSPEISIKKLAEIYKDAAGELLGYNDNVVYEKSQDKDYLTHNPSRRCPDITKARKLLNFNPLIRVEEGVKRFLEYLMEERNGR